MSGTDATGDYGVAQVLSGALRTGGVKRWKAEAERLRAALSSVHLALGESPDSDDASLGEAVAIRLRERDERIHALEARAAELERERDGLRKLNAQNDEVTSRTIEWLQGLLRTAESALASERARVGELERGIREARAHIFAKLPEEQDPPRNRLQVVACMLNETLRMTAPSPGTDHEDRKP